jgi:DNA polymerase III epsilon subunit-like protein
MNIEPITVFFDTETTGLTPGVDKVIEFAAVACNKKREIISKFQIYIDPEREIPYDAFRVHGMNRDFLLERGAKPFKESFPLIQKYIADTKAILYVAHNASYDAKMMASEIDEMNGMPWGSKDAKDDIEDENDMTFDGLLMKYAPVGQCEVLDTLVMARRIESRLRDDDPDYVDLSLLSEKLVNLTEEERQTKTSRKSFSMDNICRRFGIDLSKRDNGHEALIDCEILADMYNKLLDVDKKHGAHYAKIHELRLSSRNGTDREVIKRTGPIMKW